MKYLVKQTLPIEGCVKGATVESDAYTGIDFSNPLFFEPVVELKYPVSTVLVYQGMLVRVISVGKMQYEVKNCNGSGVWTHVPESKLKEPTFFWFINSDGDVHRDFEERVNINTYGLVWKKTTGNYFKSADEARETQKAVFEMVKSGKIVKIGI